MYMYMYYNISLLVLAYHVHLYIHVPYGGFFSRITNFANDLYPEIHEINFRECIVDSLLIN